MLDKVDALSELHSDLLAVPKSLNPMCWSVDITNAGGRPEADPLLQEVLSKGLVAGGTWLVTGYPPKACSELLKLARRGGRLSCMLSGDRVDDPLSHWLQQLEQDEPGFIRSLREASIARCYELLTEALEPEAPKATEEANVIPPAQESNSAPRHDRRKELSSFISEVNSDSTDGFFCYADFNRVAGYKDRKSLQRWLKNEYPDGSKSDEKFRKVLNLSLKDFRLLALRAKEKSKKTR